MKRIVRMTFPALNKDTKFLLVLQVKQPCVHKRVDTLDEYPVMMISQKSYASFTHNIVLLALPYLYAQEALWGKNLAPFEDYITLSQFPVKRKG